VSAAVVACEKKMFSMEDIIGLVWNSIFGSMIAQIIFYKKLLITCRVIKVMPLHICIER